MRIYRIEVAVGKDRMGLYSGTLAHSSLYCENRCPSPFSKLHEPDLSEIFRHDADETRKWFFGFKNIKQLEDWLTPNDKDLQDWLYEENAFIVAYDVSEKAVIQGRKQVIFLKRYAQEVKATAFECAIEDMRIAV